MLGVAASRRGSDQEGTDCLRYSQNGESWGLSSDCRKPRLLKSGVISRANQLKLNLEAY